MIDELQRAVIEHYLADPSRRKGAAYAAVYGKPSNPSVVTKFFKQTNVAMALDMAVTGAVRQSTINAKWVLDKAVQLASFNIRKFLRRTPNGQMIYDFSNATDDDWWCIDEIAIVRKSVGRGDDMYDVEDIKIKTTKKLDALKLIGSHVNIGAWVQQQEEEQHAATAIADALKELARSLPT
jgi:hypothetical protein